MRASVSENVRVKAAGGIRDKETFEAMIKAGAERIGTSSGKKLIG
jgi:deoxyribose-phosphate aldolase